MFEERMTLMCKNECLSTGDPDAKLWKENCNGAWGLSKNYIDMTLVWRQVETMAKVGN